MTTVLSISLIQYLSWEGLSVQSEMLVTIEYSEKKIPRQEFWILFEILMKNIAFFSKQKYAQNFKGFQMPLNPSRDPMDFQFV